MSWPISQDYNEAIQSPATNFTDPDLKKGQVVTSALGLPIPFSGNFADVYQVRCPDGSRWAVKCFTREAHGLRERYQEISAWLRKAKLPFTVDFSYLEQGIRIAGKWYPILKMQWVEGLTLNQFVGQYLDKPAMLEALLQLWAKMGKYLRAAQVGHCDLQHGNVLLVPGSTPNALALKLIDYDGMWIPTLAKTQSGEVGHANFQHPRRLREGTYNLEVDRFPLLLVATAMRALKADKGLWAKYDNGDNLLFKESDLAEPTQSALFEELASLPDAGLVMLAAQVRAALKGGVESAALLEDALPEVKAPKAAVAPSKPIAGPPSGTGLINLAPRVAPTTTAFAFDAPGAVASSGPYSTRITRNAAKKKAAGAPVGLLAAAVVGIVVLITGAAGAYMLTQSNGANKPIVGPPLAQTRPLDANAHEKVKSTPSDRHQDEPLTKVVPTKLSPDKEIVARPDASGDFDRQGPIGEVRAFTGHTGEILRLDLSPDGKQLLTGSMDRTVRLWDTATGRELQNFTPPEPAYSVIFLPDGVRALSAGGDKTVRLWDLKDGREIRSFTGHTQPIYRVAVSRDGKIAASCGPEDEVFLWDVETGKELRRLEGNKGGTECLAFSPDGKFLLTGAIFGPIQLWNVETGAEARRFTGHAAKVCSLAFTSDGQLALSCSEDQTACLWNVENGREVRRFGDHLGALWGAAITPNGQRVLTAGVDGEVRLWDATTAKELYRFPAHPGRILSVALSPDGRYGFSAGDANVARMWRLPPADYVPPPSAETPLPVVKKPEPKPAAPDEALLADAMKEVKDDNKAEYAKKKPIDIQALAAKLLQDGIDAKGKPTLQFALLRAAGDLAAKSGDFPFALRAADETANRFDVDAQEMQLKIIEAGSRAAATPAANAHVAEAALPLAEEAEDADDFDAAEGFMKIANATARATNIVSLTSALQGRSAEIEALRKAYEPVKAALQTLAGKPDDADANLVLGSYLCLSKGDWSQGLPALAQGSNAKLKALAIADLGSTSDPDAQVELAMKYLTQAEGESGAVKAHLNRRACYWYRKATAHLTGLPLTEATKKIAEIEKTIPHQHPAIVCAFYGTFDQWLDVSDKVRSLLLPAKGHNQQVKADPGLLGVANPNIGQNKTMVVVYRSGGQTCLSITSEGGTATIPAAPGAEDVGALWPAPDQELLVLAARFGAEGTWVDATAPVRHLVHGQTLSGFLGAGVGLGNPVNGKLSTLCVVYRYGNRTRFKAIAGDQSVELGAVPAKP